MITAVDSSVFLDVLTDDPVFATLSEAALRKASTEGKLIVCECVLSEIYPAVGGESQLNELLKDWYIEYVPMSLESAILAGKFFGVYLSRRRTKKPVIPDFLIRAHALTHADRLLSRDRGYLKDYFDGLKLLDPSGR